VIAKNNYEQDKTIEYATSVQKLQYELGLTISHFLIWICAITHLIKEGKIKRIKNHRPK
jgi:hypothetical protein